MKKLEGQSAEVMKGIIHDGDTVIEIDGKKYYLFLSEEPQTSVTEDVESDPELKQHLLEAKKNIADKKTYTTKEVIDMIDRDEL
ncbi:hypothetical protein HUG15_02690 [Salicibibacter cibarius]|uniref:Uncharacterized protein n=1 Tax=Salicibibacter cibarius TaxID=2743000 RepID=A0A7T7CAD9_9BACI|nr:hypothetical protein [Salicibibacter cibarius]QQK74614.1 hypothetical protein HUG15_02690 [Salicibibacter cibarius]